MEGGATKKETVHQEFLVLEVLPISDENESRHERKTSQKNKKDASLR